MKIGLSGINFERNKEVIAEVQKLWPKYVSPTATIYDESIDFEKLASESNNSVKENLTRLNDSERENFLLWYMLLSQYDKYEKQKYIIYNGSPMDLFVSAMVMKANEEVSDEYISKVIYYFKRYMKRLDVVYWLPNVDGTDNLDEIDAQCETIYNGIYDQYRNHFRESVYFDNKNCSAFIRFNTTNYIEEMKLILDHNGNLFGGDDNHHDLKDTVKLQGLFQRNPEALQALQQGEEDRNKGKIML